MNNRYFLIGLGLLLLLIFGGGFVIRLLQEGDFYLAEFICGVAGILLLLIGVFSMKKNQRFN